MGLSDFFLEVLYWRIVPSLTTVLLTYGFLVLVARLLGIRQSKWLYWLSAIPLIKGLAVLIIGAESALPIPTAKPFVFGTRLWIPFVPSIPSVHVPDLLPPPVDSFVLLLVVVALAAILVGALVLRWGSLLTFYRSLGETERLAREDAPRVFRALDKLVPLMRTPYPEVAVADTAYLLPCTLGARHPVILL
ncbi:MAG: hypothetical protein HW414_212, partial [Dehalococcoidia bacterium]|nr:hypothetical protein [Dehalococcoidia bacterium]